MSPLDSEPESESESAPGSKPEPRSTPHTDPEPFRGLLDRGPALERPRRSGPPWPAIVAAVGVLLALAGGFLFWRSRDETPVAEAPAAGARIGDRSPAGTPGAPA